MNPRIVEQYGVNEGTTEDVLSMQELPFGTSSGPYTLERRDATGTRVERWPDYHKHTPADDKFHDKRSRQALQKSLDYQRIIDTIWTFGGKLKAPITDLLSAYQKLSQDELATWYRWDPDQARALWAAADFEVPVETIKIFGTHGDTLVADLADLYAGMIQEALGVETEVELVDGNTWAARAVNRDEDVKDWELLIYGNGASGGTTGIPNDSHLINYDPRSYGFNAFNHYAESPRAEIAADSETIIGMLDAQEAETDVEARAELLTDVQRWILDNHWCNWAPPISAVSFYGFHARLQDFGANDWLNGYDRRRESMWLADA